MFVHKFIAILSDCVIFQLSDHVCRNTIHFIIAYEQSNHSDCTSIIYLVARAHNDVIFYCGARVKMTSSCTLVGMAILHLCAANCMQ